MKRISTLVILYSLSKLALAQCATCNMTISSSSSSPITINTNNQKVCFTGGTYTGTITLNGTGNSICIGSSATIGTGATMTLNGNNITVDNYGSVTISNLSLNNNAVYNNRGTTNITNQLNINTNGITYNQISGMTTVGNNFNVNTNAQLNISGGAFRQTNASQTSNNNSLGTTTVSNNAILDVAGNLVNNSTINVNGASVKVGGNFTNNGGATMNIYGLLQVSGSATNNGLIQTSGSNCSKMQIAGAFTNNGSGSINGTSTANIDLCVAGSVVNFGTITNQQPANCSCNVQLAIDLLDFSLAYLSDTQQINISWYALSTASEDKFYIEKSFDAINFQEIAQRQTAQIAQPQRYTITDEATTNGYIYYRLKMQDSDGRIRFSPAKVIKVAHQKADFLIFPNPATQKTNIKLLNVGNDVYFLKIYNMQGVLIMEETLKSYQNNEINLSQIPQGTYWITCIALAGKDIFQEKKIIVVK